MEARILRKHTVCAQSFSRACLHVSHTNCLPNLSRPFHLTRPPLAPEDPALHAYYERLTHMPTVRPTAIAAQAKASLRWKRGAVCLFRLRAEWILRHELRPRVCTL